MSAVEIVETAADDERGKKLKLSREYKEEVGIKCKRILDYARLCFLKEHGYDTSMYYYVESSTTLENCCFVSKLIE